MSQATPTEELPFHLSGNFAPVFDELTEFDLEVGVRSAPKILEHVEETREGLRHAAGVGNGDPRRPEAQQSEAHRHAVIGIGLHGAGPRSTRMHDQTIWLFAGFDPQPP